MYHSISRLVALINDIVASMVILLAKYDCREDGGGGIRPGCTAFIDRISIKFINEDHNKSNVPKDETNLFAFGDVIQYSKRIPIQSLCTWFQNPLKLFDMVVQ